MKPVLSICLILGMCAFADATPRGRAVNCNHHAAAFVAPVVELRTPVVTFRQFELPLYSVQYSGETASSSAALSAKVDALNARLDALGKPGFAMPRADAPEQIATLPNTANDLQHVALAKQSCASCHDSSVSNAKGGKFTLFAGGKLANLSPDDLGEIIARVASGDMPKGGKMSAEDRLKLISGFTAAPEPAKK